MQAAKLQAVFRRAGIACLLAALAGLPFGSASALPSQKTAATAPTLRPTPAQAAAPDADALLIGLYQDLGANRLRSALAKADALIAAYPNFHLAHLIRGDLLLMHTQPVQALGAAPGAPAERLQNLRHEAQARMLALRQRPDPKLVPAALLQLRPDQRVAYVVDTRRSRLYVYENRNGYPHFLTDYYISQGKLGINKLREGDQKTPLGVYYVTKLLQGKKLPDFYGSGALPISYPNEWDRLHGRSGSGIWLHGTPADSFSRPPLSSDGCVVLTNPDLLRLVQTAEIGVTPVVITDDVRFVSRDKLDRDRVLANGLTDHWRRDFAGPDPQRLRAHYSRNFKAEQGNLDTWLERQKKWLSALPNASLTVRDISYFRYPGTSELLVATFTQDAAQNGRPVQSQRMRQYWAQEGAQWRIVAESAWQ
ncbi:murein L,D-transpeptidase family protein [Lacisediminimonas sp.]|uniref:L,D-transpeptidase family protein n=1 Tax=Lacisediminimonas sp. TaxID=3060582 RepID=UPI002725D932|nr:L,D-transpeptidase family protein [Lacisediminimonas sp.]MDO8299966.1 L,D-transpeptidase family protein [Lacisediminimonas sp.]MDO9219256.1 L,D-transpeptidase family protein [Lacisediminimonas sp.]